ncbi:MAG: hypothetical protein A3C90_03090 [Candidatus Magasanikbacteria bacterium RIFCSPHIGHO2_02_FULL_51_14]|uniref:Aminotransferase class V domain-containing protein n=1 Tax=Candidatus Magasanikbacteria bacterium RIFCSPHIGHO2_02_FULL_51_14 TaxID=1798683 RepID=A0A1F6MHJ0_9BACT|nr:MAG: hypothetical protein A3C90_03090 [Candidatus Magasanikbacteria bacterium RIFCSPHIGHO2_02_FULL_51_14]
MSLFKKSRRKVYLDHAAATPLDSRVLSAMVPYLKDEFGNASALYALGVSARKAIEDARASVARVLRTTPDTIVFTSGGTEANNLAVRSVIPRSESSSDEESLLARKHPHLITTTIEHDSVLQPIKQLEREGFEVTYLPVDSEGRVSVKSVSENLRSDTILVSIMYANNEIGTIQPIAEIGREILKWRKNKNSPYPYFHTDACQAINYLSVAVDALHVDLMTFNASKIYGPKGVGGLYKRRGVEIATLLYGGGQEFGLRSGTENVAGIVGLGKAMEIAEEMKAKEVERVDELQRFFWEKIENEIKNAQLNGPVLGENRLVNNLNISFRGIEAEALVLYLDAKGIACSTGSACSTSSALRSHVLEACGYSKERIESSVRFTLGRGTTMGDIDYAVAVMRKVVNTLQRK